MQKLKQVIFLGFLYKKNYYYFLLKFLKKIFFFFFGCVCVKFGTNLISLFTLLFFQHVKINKVE